MKRLLLDIEQRLAQRLTRAVIYNDDVFLVSFPRSGNTWVSFLLANVMNEHSGMDVEVNFFNLTDFVPEFSFSGHQVRQRGVGAFPRILKSHSEVNPSFKKVLLLVRDPRDVMVSYYLYLKGLGQIPRAWTISRMIRHKKFGIDAWIRHTDGWLQRASQGRRVHCFRYEDFAVDARSQVSEMFQMLGHKLPEHVLDKAVKKSSKDEMQRLENRTRTARLLAEKNEFAFVRKGVVGDHDALSAHDHDFIRQRAQNLMVVLKYEL